MLVPLAGLNHLALTTITIPRPLNELIGCKDTFYIANGFTDKEIADRVKLYQDSMENIGHTDVFNISVERIAPIKGLLYDSLAIGEFLSMFAKSCSLTYSFLGLDKMKVGATNLKHFSNKENGELSITFYNPAEKLAEGYFLKDATGEDIIPKDGSTLLPFDYYFEIKLWKWIVREGIRIKSYYIEDYYHLNSNIGIEWDSDSESHQAFSVQFTKLDVGGITPPHL